MIEKAITVSKLGAMISFIIPSLWLTNTYFSRLRHVMAYNCQLLQLVDLGFGVFEEVVETSIFFARKISDRGAYEVILAAKGAVPELIDRLPRVVSSNEIIVNVETGFAFFSQKTDLKTKFAGIAETLARSFVVYRGVE